MLKLLFSLFIFLALTSLISYHVIGNTKKIIPIQINSIGIETDQIFLGKILVKNGLNFLDRTTVQ